MRDGEALAALALVAALVYLSRRTVTPSIVIPPNEPLATPARVSVFEGDDLRGSR
jgi:hypothetical protein